MTTIRKYFGDVHPYRWFALTLWILVFTGITFVLIRQNREAVHDVKVTKASVLQLQRTNCALRGFLLAAGQARVRSAKNDVTLRQRESDLRAAASYARLAHTFDGRSCPKGIR